MGQRLCERDVKWHQLGLRLGLITRAAVRELGWTPTSMGLGVPLVDIMALPGPWWLSCPQEDIHVIQGQCLSAWPLGSCRLWVLHS